MIISGYAYTIISIAGQGKKFSLWKLQALAEAKTKCLGNKTLFKKQ